MNNEQGQVMAAPKTVSVSQEIMQHLDKLANQAEKTGCRIAEQLQDVCMQSIPAPEKVSAAVEREYPTYFGGLREKLITIEYALERINGVLDRCGI